VPEAEADEWIGWGIHVFHDGEDGEGKGATLERYLHRRFDEAAADPGGDFFSALVTAEIDGRRLTREEMLGIGNLTFAGGRDTIIHTVSSIVAHLAVHPEVLAWLRDDPKRAVLAAEEFFRVVSPLTHIGRVCPATTGLHGETVGADERISLCWASANRDAEAFESPGTTDLARKPNPHLAFGAGPHFCLGAAHARLVVRALLEVLAERVGKVGVLDAEAHVETTPEYRREVGYDRLRVRFEAVGGGGSHPPRHA
jgi:cytochrome P450